MHRPSLLTVAIALSLDALLAGCSSGNECPTCIREKCAELLAVCETNLDCACVATCTGERGVPGVADCLTECGVAQRPPGFAPFEVCVATACPDSEDECSTPADYTAPAALECEQMSMDIGGGTLADCGFDPLLAFDPEGSVLQLASADGGLCVRIERRNDGAGELANTRWTLLDIAVGPLGEVAAVTDSDACWYSSHHNFRDVVHAWSGTHRYDLLIREDGHGGPRIYELFVFEQGPVNPAACSASLDGTACLQGPIALVPVNP